MSQDIRSFFKALPSNKSNSTTSSTTVSKNKRPVITESSDEDIVPVTPKPVKVSKTTKKRKLQQLSSESDSEKNVSTKKKNSPQSKSTKNKLKSVDISTTFSSTPIKQTPVIERPVQEKPPEEKKTVKRKKKDKANSKTSTEVGIHNDKNFEQSLLDLDDDFFTDLDELDKTANEILKNSVTETPQDNKTQEKPIEKPSEPTPKRQKSEEEHHDGDPDQERHERKRQSYALYQKYLNRSGPAHHGSKELPKGTPTCLSGLCFLRTGVLDSLENEEFETLIKDHGGRVVHGVSKKVSYIVVGEDPGPAKLEKAKTYGIKQLSEDELLDLIRTKSGQKPSSNDNTNLEQISAESAELIHNNKKTTTKEDTESSNTSQKLVNGKHNATPSRNKSKDVEPMPKPEKKSETTKKPNIIVIKPEPKPAQIHEIPNDSVPWTEKYKPRSIKSIIGQQTEKSNMNRLIHWLQNWYKNHGSKNKPKLIKPSPWAKSDDGAYFKAALLSGPPGIGKTTTATLVAKELGFDVVEFNASDTRNKRLLHEEVSQLLSTKSLAGYFTSGSAPTSKHVLLMDEVDGMAGNEDRGGVQELISLIKNSNIPVICMCNDRNHPKIRSLSNYCFDLRFSRPRMEQIKGAMMSVCFKEGVKISSDALSEIITSSGMDVRQILTHLSLWSADKSTDSDIKAPKKDSPLGPWEVCRLVFSAENHKTNTIVDREKLFYYDYSIAPLFVQENYLKVLPHAPKSEHLQRFSAAADCISMGDLVDTGIRRTNNWSLLNMEAMCLSVLPGSYLSGHVNAQIDFPSWLGKNSKRNKFVRLLGELQAHMRTSISANRTEVNLDYLSTLRMSLVNPLIKKGGEGVPDSLNVMHNYNLLREDLDSILELAQWPKQKDPMNMVDSKVKAAFTRAYNKSSAMLPYAVQTAVSKKRGATSNEEEYGLGEEEEEEEVEDDKDINQDAMIKAKKTTAKAKKKDEPSTSGAKGAAKTSKASTAKKAKK
ncbi:hypothetical protein PPYR_08582 [Photinus pyralis]|uniref:Replication factor C subunit 1 n=1 Tax=Photinus pyralis TaxID=7054 RepID=A0A5N4AJV0_PHOPY|nr:replication factor C subunit 1 [Photinus pyralis]KAB0797589.1 hypothetical protein PPYR_08582 [Photinus pyralis]